MDGLCWTGLRLSEALAVTWGTSGFHIDMTVRHAMLRIPADDEKGNQDRLLPIAPEAAEFLLQTPENARTGPVFNPANINGKTRHSDRDQCSRTIARIGKEADVVVDQTSLRGKPHTKYAGAHELRRSFGLRGAMRVRQPIILQQLMRHETIKTTLRYYVGRNAEVTTDLLDEALNDTSGNTPADTCSVQSPLLISRGGTRIPTLFFGENGVFFRARLKKRLTAT